MADDQLYFSAVAYIAASRPSRGTTASAPTLIKVPIKPRDTVERRLKQACRDGENGALMVYADWLESSDDRRQGLIEFLREWQRFEEDRTRGLDEARRLATALPAHWLFGLGWG